MDKGCYWVYQIKIGGVVRYIGMTNNIHKRQLEHRRALKNGDSKYLYRQIRLMQPEACIELEPVREFDNKGDCKRWECFLILGDYFSDKNLWQSFPVSIKYF
jgi:predicted GIY-YIG superfamily endonuclease